MIASPCVRNCCLDQHDCCLGCGRLLEEITQWHSANDARRLEIIQLSQQRLAKRKTHLLSVARQPFTHNPD